MGIRLQDFGLWFLGFRNQGIHQESSNDCSKNIDCSVKSLTFFFVLVVFTAARALIPPHSRIAGLICSSDYFDLEAKTALLRIPNTAIVKQF